jgi:hypothetical protein
MVAAELDLVVPAASIEKQAQRGIDAGLPIAFKQMADYGHTLMVGVALEEIVPRLLVHRLNGD